MRRSSLAAAVILGLSGSVIAAPPPGAAFVPLGNGFGAFNIPTPSDMTPDGAVIVGTGVPTVGGGRLAFEAWRWTTLDGMVGLGDLPGGRQRWSRGLGVSADGGVVVGSGDTGDGLVDRPFVWTNAMGMVEMPLPPTDVVDQFGYATDVTADGQRIVGWTWDTVNNVYAGVLWTSPTTPTAFPGLGAVKMTSDGATIVGNDQSLGDFRAWRWRAGTGVVFLAGATGSGGPTEAAGVSEDGEVVVGSYQSLLDDGAGGFLTRAFRWTSAGGMVDLGGLPCGVHASSAGAVSGDGSVVVGNYGCPTESTRGRAFIWTAADGMRDLNTVATVDYQLDLMGWELTNPTAITPDGRRIAGLGIDIDGVPGAWMLVLPPLCRADFNGVGGVTVQDIYDFLSAWSEEDASADFNGVGGVTVQDIYDFLSAWSAGCQG